MGEEKADPGQVGVDAGDGEHDRVGMVVDRYTLVRILGRGGMGAVYEARHAKLARRFAIKFLLPEFAGNREILRRFENEAKAAGGLEHPNLAAVTDFGRAEDGAPYIVMEFLEGEDCARLLRRAGRLSAARAVNIVAQACRGLAIAHRANIVHRDLKPENIFVTDAGDGRDLVKVLDFGIAKLRATDASVITGTGATFGTAFYMSPEQARGAGDVDPRTDVWSLGVVLYELLAGQKPFVGGQFLEVVHQILSFEPPPLAALRPDLPPGLVAAVDQAMKKDVTARTASVLALGDALAPFASERPPAPPAAQPLGPTMPTPSTRTPAVSAASKVASQSAVTQSAGAPRRRKHKATAFAGITLAAATCALLAVGSHRRPASPSPPSAGPVPTESTVVVSPKPAPLVASPPASTLAPAPPVAHVSHVRTPSEQSKRNPGRHAGQVPAKPAVTRATAATGPNPTLPQTKPAAGHRLEIDKDDPFGP